jgi:sugar lactone lactonase YvrE
LCLIAIGGVLAGAWVIGGQPTDHGRAPVAPIVAEASATGSLLGTPPLVAEGGVSGAAVSPPSSVSALHGSGPIVTAVADHGPFPNGLLIADRGNGRLIVVNDTKRIVWRFPAAGSLPRGRAFSADDAFFAPDGKTIVANDEGRNIIYRIDIATKKIIWSYGHYRSAGSAKGYLNTPDDAYPLANGDIVVADINNCRILEIAPNKSIVRTWGTTGRCTNAAPRAYAAPNGDTPLPDGGLLVTVIHGSRVVRLSATGRVIFDIHVPIVYPSDAQLLANGNVVVAGYTSPGAVIEVTPKGRLVWRYAPASGPGRLDHPSLATPLANGLVSINDDGRQRMIVIDPRTMKIVWQYGKTGVTGRGSGFLSDPDGHQPVPANVAF